MDALLGDGAHPATNQPRSSCTNRSQARYALLTADFDPAMCQARSIARCSTLRQFCIRMQIFLHSYASPPTNCDVRKTLTGFGEVGRVLSREHNNRGWSALHPR